jgi:hypothetical protein
VGDRAIEQTLDAMERARREHPREGLRHRIDHCGITPPDLQDASQPGHRPGDAAAFFWEFGDGYIRNYGRHRADVMFPAKSLIEAGVRCRGILGLAGHGLPAALRHRAGADARDERRRHLRPGRARRPGHGHPDAHDQRRLR